MCNLCEENPAVSEYYLDDYSKIMVCDDCYEIINAKKIDSISKNHHLEIAFLREYVAAVKMANYASSKVLKLKGVSK